MTYPGFLKQSLLLLHRSGSSFFILGTTGNVYTVTLSTLPSCNCPEPSTFCKHIVFVFLRVLGVSLDDPCLRQSTLTQSQISRLLKLPTSTRAVASDTICQRFKEMFFSRRPNVEVDDGTSCPICLEEMSKKEKLVACEACRNPIHDRCFVKWKRSKKNREVTCVICRAPWREEKEGEDDDDGDYLNLAAYLIQEYMDEAVFIN